MGAGKTGAERALRVPMGEGLFPISQLSSPRSPGVPDARCASLRTLSSSDQCSSLNLK
jgi:hypothetical protein